jgi:hypothetical protein
MGVVWGAVVVLPFLGLGLLLVPLAVSYGTLAKLSHHRGGVTRGREPVLFSGPFLARSSRSGNDVVVNPIGRDPRQSGLTFMSCSVLVAAVAGLSIRVDADPQAGGGLAAMLTMGVLLFVAPVVWAIRVVGSTKQARVAAGVVMVAASVVVATRPVGNLVALWYPLTALCAVVVLAGVGAALRMTRRRHP